MSRDIGDTCYVKLPQPKVNVPVYSDNIIFATGTTGYRSDKPMTGNEPGEIVEFAKSGEPGKAGIATRNSKGGSAFVCEYHDAYRRFVNNTYETAKAMKSGGGIGIVSARHKKSRRHNGDGSMNIENIYTRFSIFGYSGRNNVNSNVLYRKGK